MLQDAIDIYKTVPRTKGMSVHVLTGPIYVEGAEPGDMLEVRIHSLDLRVPYGVNNSGPTSGVLLGLLSAPAPKIIKLDTKRNVALFSDDIEVPLSPFLGIMSVAPSRDVLLVSSRPPWRWAATSISTSSWLVPAFIAGIQYRRAVLHRRPACRAGRR